MDESIARSRHPDAIRKVFMWALFPTLLLVLDAADLTYAQVVTNITPTTTAPFDLGTEVDTVGSTTEITGGTRPGRGTGRVSGTISAAEMVPDTFPPPQAFQHTMINRGNRLRSARERAQHWR